MTFLTVGNALGYKPDIKNLGSPVIAKALSTSDLDVFLDYWSPAADGLYNQFVKDKKVEVVRNNVEGAKYTFATTETAYNAGLKHIKDLPKFAKQLDNKVYGIEPGNEGNDHFRAAFKKHNIQGFTVVESSEAGMLTQVEKNKDGYVVFLGWAPHWMGFLYKMKYLDGGDEWFGKGGGLTNIKTVVRSGLKADCPNFYKYLKNVKFTLPMENEVMFKIGKEKKDPKTAATEYLKAHPDVLTAWLAGVTTANGGDAVAAVKKSLGM
ncbi:MAG: glycine betaine ABC transporter substrate-binding protein [Hydrotalea sp.]|nr:glycine betaine ABC transporter substrate-binding protein [Hydrotalea sp.]